MHSPIGRLTQFDDCDNLGWLIAWATVGLARSVAAIWSGIHTARPTGATFARIPVAEP